ncbi:SDR family oxidoreductase [Actinokineospora globicatena]|uniref:Enoyl-(Acyl carrier protein) reductase n=1 Tax=Actinokineospora globicatena TaxID=103729 RepID=A0A9W6QKB0_9PSEU|nr:SDR family oxidoreductase [Actinokineospora globicatena]GLW90069.1 hypothetical protein Aglo03_08850 [Actinokineospora globicatena]
MADQSTRRDPRTQYPGPVGTTSSTRGGPARWTASPTTGSARTGGPDGSPIPVKSFGAQAPLGRPAQPAKLAPTYVYLASQESGYVTGETIAVTGGSPIT